MFLAPTAFVYNDVCRAEREVVGRLFYKGRATGLWGRKCGKYRGKSMGTQSLTGGPLITDKFRQAPNDGFRQMTNLGWRKVIEGPFSDQWRRAGTRVSAAKGVRSSELVDSSW